MEALGPGPGIPEDQRPPAESGQGGCGKAALNPTRTPKGGGMGTAERQPLPITASVWSCFHLFPDGLWVCLATFALCVCVLQTSLECPRRP